jgi:hypothetical protein
LGSPRAATALKRGSVVEGRAPISGYSGKSLGAKIGVNPGTRIAAIAAPKHYEQLLADVIDDAHIKRCATQPPRGMTFEIVHLFADRRTSLAKHLKAALGAVREGGALWISWPKKSSAYFVDLTEDEIRELVLPTGWVDVKVAAIDEE